MFLLSNSSKSESEDVQIAAAGSMYMLAGGKEIKHQMNQYFE
jgi:hypothetical protein